MAARLLAGLPRFLRTPPALGASRRALEQGVREREARLLDLVRRGIYERAGSPYLALLDHAGITCDGFAGLLRAHGIEGTLTRLYDAGVHVTLDEFKGRRPIQRGSLTIATGGKAFDNPLLTPHYELRSSGSRGPGSRFIVDLELLKHEANYDVMFLEMFGLASRPWGLWHPAPPGAAGLKWALRLARLGHPVERWFSQTPVSFGIDAKHAALVRAIAIVSRLSGRRVAVPEHVGLSDALTVARWLAECHARRTPACLSTTASAVVRICVAAREHDLDISGTFFRSSGEPLSPARAAIVAEAGCVVRCHYAMAEIGRLGMACGHPSEIDDVHIVTDKIAILQREIALRGGARVSGLVLTTLLWSVPKVMVNVELGDYGVLDRRRCGCVWEEMGFALHLHTIRSYEKLTSEGMHFVGADLMKLVDEVLPGRFGGDATDYQFVEQEEGGLPRVSLIVSPRVGPVSVAEIQACVLNTLGSRDAAHRMMAGLWRDGETLRVERREPYSTGSGKIHTLHVPQLPAGVS